MSTLNTTACTYTLTTPLIAVIDNSKIRFFIAYSLAYTNCMPRASERGAQGVHRTRARAQGTREDL